jgi:hypothetical protein
MQPLSIGITPLDGILTFLEAHQGKDADQIFGTGGASLADSLIDIAQLLYASGDNYDARVQAQDLIAQQNFAKLGRWFDMGLCKDSCTWPTCRVSQRFSSTTAFRPQQYARSA